MWYEPVTRKDCTPTTAESMATKELFATRQRSFSSTPGGFVPGSVIGRQSSGAASGGDKCPASEPPAPAPAGCAVLTDAVSVLVESSNSGALRGFLAGNRVRTSYHC